MTDMQSQPLTPNAQALVAGLARIPAVLPPVPGPTVHVASIGRSFYLVYEQVRNAADYREHHLLLRGAIERFLTRSLNLRAYEPVAVELITELTQAGYLKNDSVAYSTSDRIDALLERYAVLAASTGAHTDRTHMTRWIMQVASGQIEAILEPRPRLAFVMSFAYAHYWESIDRAEVGATTSHDQIYQVSLHCAVQRAIFKSDLATTRYTWMAAQLDGLTPENFEGFLALNQLIDDAYAAPLTNRTARLINRYGAPMRILAELVTQGLLPDLNDRAELLDRIRRVCAQQYTALHRRIGARIIRVLFFIFLTKVLLGVAIEVPYDLLMHGSVAWMPLVINVLFPIAYMGLISLRIAEPDRHNTEVVAGYIDRMLYAGTEPIRYRLRRRVPSLRLRHTFNTMYALAFAISFGLLIWTLMQLGFNLANGFIFFIFLSAVSFLGFRLRQLARELAMLDMRQSLLQTLADFLSTPFIRVGYWLSDRYAKLNLMAALLDAAIELPLKTLLRLIHQWTGYLRDRQEEL